MAFATEFSFTLPRGLIDASGQVQREGRMRLATGLDEILSVQDPRVQANEAYLPILLLSRVVVQLGALAPLSPDLIGGLFAIDLAYLEDLYERINSPEALTLCAVCPYCSQQFAVQVSPLG